MGEFGVECDADWDGEVYDGDDRDTKTMLADFEKEANRRYGALEKKFGEVVDEVMRLNTKVRTSEELMAEMRKLVAQRDNALGQRRLTDQEFIEIKRQRDHAKALNEELTEALKLAHHECAVLRIQLREQE